MDYLQYADTLIVAGTSLSFKPYYKWITFNTSSGGSSGGADLSGFKPYYKWITFNTYK